MLILVGSVVEPKLSWSPEGYLGIILTFLTWLLWPTWVLMMDAEHASQIAFMLPLSVLVNGTWYGVVGLLIWQLRHRKG